MQSGIMVDIFGPAIPNATQIVIDMLCHLAM
jgi:hypothetical protein